MLKMVKYFKKSFLAILAIVALLVIQAACDLSLPQYTSNIVNVGIQQGGIENATPEKIRQSTMDKLLLFMSETDQQTVSSYYTKTAVEGDTETVLNLNTQDKLVIEQLTAILAKPMLIVGGIESGNDMVKSFQEQILAQLPPEMAGNKISIFEILSQLPKEQLAQIQSEIDEKFSEMPETIVEQTAVAFTQQEYDAVGMNTNKMQSGYIFSTGVKMLGIALLSMVATVIVGFLAARVSARLGRDLRKNVFSRVVSFGNDELDKFSTASLITRSTNDIQQIQMLMVMLLRIVFYAPIMAVGGIIKVLNTNTSMAWIIAVAVMVLLGIVLTLFVIVMPRFKLMQKLVDKLNLVTREILTGIPVIRAFSTQKHEEKRFDKANADLTKTNLFVNRVMTCMMPMMMLLMNGITVLIVWNGAAGIDSGAMQVGDLMAFIQYAMQIIMSFLMISMVSIMLPRASVSAVRIDEVLQTNPVIHDTDQAISLPADGKGRIEFRNVSFRYPNAEEDVISNISFTANPGETTAFIGSTGSGKSTLINLIPRFYDVSDGEILVDGVNIKNIKTHDLRKQIGYVPQKGILFSGTIESNIKYGDTNTSDEQMKLAAEIAQASDFINEKPNTYQETISQGGTNVSGGQKQRLSIARAIAKKPQIYIFDDSFSALDYKTDVALRKALKKHTANSTVLIVAQRISTIMHAEQIIVLDEGQVIGKGTHKELLKSCEVYHQIASSQLSKEEMDNE